MLLVGDNMQRKLIVTYLTWYYLSRLFLENDSEIIELDIKEALKK